jgi:DHA1 family bicyclomycin/chloramphenicol resistance-like MFS transporter
MKQKKHFSLILILGALTALGPFAIDMYLPSFPVIAKNLNITTSEVSYSLTSYFIGISFGQLIYGPLLDRYGRLRPLYAGLTIFIFAAIGCAFSSSIEQLIVLRLIQALGGCVAGVAANAMVRDLFPPRETPKIFALLMLVLGTSPMIAPTFGSYASAHFGWQAIFVILALMAVCMIISVRFGLKETVAPDTTYSLDPKTIMRKYISVLKEPQFITYAITGSITIAALLAYVSNSPIVFMEIFKVSDKVFGWIFAFLSIGFILSNQVNSFMLRKYTSEQMIIAAYSFQLVISLLLVILTITGTIGLYGTIALLFLYFSSKGFVMPNTAGLALAPFAKNAGSAAAMFGALQMTFGSIATMLLGSIKSESPLPLAITFLACSIVPFFVIRVGQKYIHRKLKRAKEVNLVENMPL